MTRTSTHAAILADILRQGERNRWTSPVGATEMTYAKRAYFDGDHCQHCADREERERLERIAATYRKVADRARRDRRARDQALRHRIKTWTGEWA